MPFNPYPANVPPPTPAPRERNCLRIAIVGCVSLALFLALLVGILVLLGKFVWDLHLDKWL